MESGIQYANWCEEIHVHPQARGHDRLRKATVELNDEAAEVELTKGKIDGGTVSFVEMLNLQGNELKLLLPARFPVMKLPSLAKWPNLVRQLELQVANGKPCSI